VTVGVPRSARSPRRRPGPVAAAGVVLVLGAVIGVLALRDGAGGPARVEPVPRSDRPAEDFRNLADWLRERGEG
jgi:hypothetical protein